jgi:uncharacterized protein YlzI (FlbEa/FlbD family)
MKKIILLYITEKEIKKGDAIIDFLADIDYNIVGMSANEYGQIFVLVKAKFNELVAIEKNYIVDKVPVFMLGYEENGKTFFTNKISEKNHYQRHVVQAVKDLYSKIQSGAKIETGTTKEYNESKEKGKNEDGSVLVKDGETNWPVPDVVVNFIEGVKDIIDNALDAVCTALPEPLNQICEYRKWIYLTAAGSLAYKAIEAKNKTVKIALGTLSATSAAMFVIEKNKESK